MKIPFVRTMPVALLAILIAVLPLSPRMAQACPSMPGASSMDHASASCCASGCQCGVSSQSGEVELALLPATLLPSGPSSEISKSAFLDVPGISSQEVQTISSDESPPLNSGKEKIYDIQSDYRI